MIAPAARTARTNSGTTRRRREWLVNRVAWQVMARALRSGLGGRCRSAWPPWVLDGNRHSPLRAPRKKSPPAQNARQPEAKHRMKRGTNHAGENRLDASDKKS